MQQLINDLLSYSKLSGPDVSLEQTDCNTVLTTVMANLATVIHKQQVVITKHNLPTVTADRMQLMQLFQNLLDNAIKYRSKKKPRIHISANLKADLWIFSVKDNGIGIDPKYFDRIFDIFQRLHRDEYPGTGIGLAICKKIVERHGGKSWVESKLGKGSTFYFSIPA
jgi:light-regulated signal transduction histidine kinase (bacteriophytochrome)